jgi:hypothetical protein
LITRYDYYTTTTAGETTAGGVAGYQQDVQIKQGQQGTLIPQETWQYYAHAYNGQTIAPVASDTVYGGTGGSDPRTTSYTYTWYLGTAQIQSETDTAPGISTTQNGPGTNAPDVTTTFFDTYAQPIWTKDPDGYINYTAFDPATGAVIKTITDVDTTKTDDFTGLPDGWSTPSGGGLHLITTMVVDALGRTTKETSPGPNNNVTYTVYIDNLPSRIPGVPDHEVRVYQGWNSTLNPPAPTGPTQVYRDDLVDGYSETFTMTATPNLTGGVPNGTEAISGLQALSRQYMDAAGQVTATYDYFNLTGLPYAVTVMGMVGVNFYQTQYGYDNRGRQSQTTTANGTIYQTVYDSLDRAVSDAVGTTMANLMQVRSYQYDNGGVGDSNLTQETESPGLGAADRVTRMWYDWRDRQVAMKSGVSATENDGVNRPIVVTTYDNLDEATETQQYDGDGVTPQIVNGVLQALSSSLLRSQEIDNYDDQGRVYQTLVYDVNPSNGTVSSSALTTNDYYDHRGDLMAESDPGGLWTKSQFDGDGLDVMDYTTDGGGGTSWAAAASVTNDIVLEQLQTVYDGDDNAIETIDSQRFDNASSPGPLNSTNARTYYTASYYDNADRLTDTVDAGTNGGVAWTRPDSVPARSDTAGHPLRLQRHGIGAGRDRPAEHR